LQVDVAQWDAEIIYQVSISSFFLLKAHEGNIPEGTAGAAG
jgi:hypothetical protein